MVSKRFAVVLAALILAALPALAKPNFSGDWKLNAAKSTFGEMPAPSSMTMKITHADPKVTAASKSSSERGEFEISATYTTDGAPTTNQGFGGNPTTSTAKWDGDVLSIETKGKFGDNDFTMQDKWSLSEDGKVLSILRTFKSSMGEAQQKLVLEKQ